MIKNFLDKMYDRELIQEMENIAPEHLQNKFGTNVIEPKMQRVFLHIAHLRLLSKCAALFMIGNFVFDVVILIYLIRNT